MTAIEAANEFYEYFQSKDSFSFKNEENYKDLVKIIGTQNDEDVRMSFYLAGLKILEEENVVKKIDEGKQKPIWVLVRSLDSYNSNVSLDSQTATYLAKLINCIYKLTNDNKTCNSRSITADDLSLLAGFCQGQLLKIAEEIKAEGSDENAN